LNRVLRVRAVCWGAGSSASLTLGVANNFNGQLRSLNVSASYMYDRTWSFTADQAPLRPKPEARTVVGGLPNPLIFRSAMAAFRSGLGSIFEFGLRSMRWQIRRFDR
jgi:hypothetical protein